MEEKDRINLLKQAFKLRYGSLNNTAIYKAPGRVNLIGEHTDYNGGLVLPIAIDRDILLMAQPRPDQTLRMDSLNLNQETTATLNNLYFVKEAGWANYVKGVADVLQKAGHRLTGLNLLYESTIPIASGLSSSAAMEVLTCFALIHQCGLKIKLADIPALAQQAENDYVGVQCGIMDQFIIALAKPDNAICLNCQTLKYEFIPLSFKEASIIIADTKVHRELARSEYRLAVPSRSAGRNTAIYTGLYSAEAEQPTYNTRRQECNEGLKILQQRLPGIKCLSDVTPEQLELYNDRLPDPLQQRCRHVVYENERVRQAMTALKTNQLDIFGLLMNESHQSLAELYQVSCFELEAMIRAARALPATLGARLTGAGFGGCTVNLVRNEHLNEFIDKVGESYYRQTNIQGDFYICQASAGVAQVTNIG